MGSWEFKNLITNKKYIIAFGGIGIIILIWLLVPPVYLLKNQSIERLIISKNNPTANVLFGPETKDWTSLTHISRHMIHALIISEDARFYQHIGIDPVEINASLIKNIEHGKYVRGASTITQQVVKMAFLPAEKTLIRKSREALGALLTELISSKEEIITWYLNLAEFGAGIYGIKNASKRYFSTKPELLTVNQAIHLAMILPNPYRWSEGLRSRKLTLFGHKRFSVIAKRMLQNGYMTKSQWQYSLATGDFGNPIRGFESLTSIHEFRVH